MWHTGMPAMLQSSEEQGEVTVALTSVFAEALKGGVSNLSFGDLSGQLGARGGGGGGPGSGFAFRACKALLLV
jgi:hypothetical protein